MRVPPLHGIAIPCVDGASDDFLDQVWPLTQFFSVSFFVKNHDLPYSLSGKYFSLPFVPATPSSPSRTLEVLFELTRRPSRALDSPRALLLELQRIKDSVRCIALGAEVPGHRQKQLTQTLIVHLLQTHFFYCFPPCLHPLDLDPFQTVCLYFFQPSPSGEPFVPDTRL